MLPNSTRFDGSVSDFPATLEEENYHLELGIAQSLRSLSLAANTEKTALSCASSDEQDFTEEPDYGLSLLFTAAKLMGD